MSTQAGIVQLRTRTSGSNGSQGDEEATPVLYAVDDDVATVELLCEVARNRGWAASGFTRLEQLTAALAVARPTLLVLDDELPDGRGGDLARRLRSDPTTVGIPVVVCTAAHPMRQAEIGGWAPVVSKPFDLEELERFLDAATRRRHGGDRLDEAG